MQCCQTPGAVYSTNTNLKMSTKRRVQSGLESNPEPPSPAPAAKYAPEFSPSYMGIDSLSRSRPVRIPEDDDDDIPWVMKKKRPAASAATAFVPAASAIAEAAAAADRRMFTVRQLRDLPPLSSSPSSDDSSDSEMTPPDMPAPRAPPPTPDAFCAKRVYGTQCAQQADSEFIGKFSEALDDVDKMIGLYDSLRASLNSLEMGCKCGSPCRCVRHTLMEDRRAQIKMVHDALRSTLKWRYVMISREISKLRAERDDLGDKIGKFY